MPDRATIARWARRSVELPPDKVARRAVGLARAAASGRLTRRRDATRSTFGPPPPGSVGAYWGALPIEALRPAAAALADATANYLRHRFDLLGSGWTAVHHGVSCPGVEGIRFESGSPVEADHAGAWLASRLSRGNAAPAARIWALVDDGYRPIDWQLDFKSGYRWSEQTWYRDVEFMDGRGRDIKVPWELSRMQHLPQLALAAALARAGESGFEQPDRYEREFRNQVLDFVATNPPRFGANWVVAMDVGFRAANWLVARDLFLAGGATFDPAFEAVLAASLADHARHVAANLEWSEALHGNHYLADVVGLLFLGAYLPRSPETDAWFAFGVRELHLEVDHQFWPDGANFEASTCYHRLSAEMVGWSVALLLGLPPDRLAALGSHPAATFGLARPLPATPVDGPIQDWLPPRLERMARFTRDVTKPSGRVAQIGDNDSGRFLALLPDVHPLRHGGSAAVIEALFDGPRPLEPEAAIVRTVVRDARLPRDWTVPSEARAVRVGGAAAFDAAGQAWSSAPPNRRRRITIAIDGDSLRDGLDSIAYPAFGFWLLRSRRLWLAIRCGPIGQQGNGGHAHNDQLSIELSVDGEDWLRDPGTYLYTPLPERRNAYRSQDAHAGPRFADGEPARLDIFAFTLGSEGTSRCLYWGPAGFVGELRSPRGRAAYTRVHVEDAAIIVEHWTEGADLAGPVGELADWTVLRPLVPFSPGYGLAEST